MRVLVTGAAGFIGMHTALRLLARGDRVIGIDNLNDYYDVSLKKARLARLEQNAAFTFHQLDVADRPAMEAIFSDHGIDTVVHLAAQAGVRYSITNPHAYAQSNLVGFLNVLEGCRSHRIKHLVYASSSSVYGGNKNMPFRESHGVDHPVSLYAATKKANELMAHSYSHLYAMPVSGLRFFTVYGPWGRPDMAPMKFARAILAGEPVPIFNFGHMWRDFTYVDDIVHGVVNALDHVPEPDASFDREAPDPSRSWAPYRVYNIGNEQPVALLDFVSALEAALGRKAVLKLLPMQAGDVVRTYSDTSGLRQLSGANSRPTPLREGIELFASWYRRYTEDSSCAEFEPAQARA